jgi:hypothetical protein
VTVRFDVDVIAEAITGHPLCRACIALRARLAPWRVGNALPHVVALRKVILSTARCSECAQMKIVYVIEANPPRETGEPYP